MGDTEDIRSFCTALQKTRVLRETVRPTLSTLRGVHDQVKEKINRFLESRDVKCVPVPGTSMFLRCSNKQYMVAITRDLVTGAVEAIPVDMITESKDAVVLSEVIFKELQSSRRCHREKVEVSEQKVRVGKGEVLSQLDQDDMDECTTLAHAFLVSSKAITTERDKLTQALRSLQGTIVRKKDRVHAFMDRQGITTQEVTLTGAAGTPERYFIRKKVHRSKPPLNVATTKGLITRSVRSVLDKEEVLTPAQLIDMIWENICERPCVETDVISLDRAPKARGSD